MARAYAAVATGWRAGHFRTAHSAGRKRRLRFPADFGGTFWMHSHEGLQEQLLLAAPLIIRDQRDRPDQQEVVVLLADFSFTPPEKIFEDLQKSGSMGGMAARAAAGAGSSQKMGGAGMKMGTAPAPKTAMGGMKMGGSAAAAPAPDLNDVKYDAFLANLRTLADPDIVKVEPGGRALLRIINGSSMSAFHIGLGALDGELIAVDGFGLRRSAGAASRSPPPNASTFAFQSRPAPAPIRCLLSSKATAGKPESCSSPARDSRPCARPGGGRFAGADARSRAESARHKAACAAEG